jgi:pimeloyl-ACP methyl ester carboxylesterase
MRATALVLLSCAALWGCAPTYADRSTLEMSALAVPDEMERVSVRAAAGEPEVDVAYLDVGSGPVVVLLHGLGEHAGYWSENVAALYEIPWQAAVVRALVDRIAPGERPLLVGHSMGGQIALRYAIAWPDRVRGLVLLAPAGIETFTPGEAAWLRRVNSTAGFAAQSEDGLRAHYRRRVFGRWVPAAEHHLEERVRIRGSREFPRYLYAVVQSIRAMLEGPVHGELGAVEGPTVVVFGDRDGLIPNPVLHAGTSEDVAAEASRRIRGARVEIIDGAGHMVQAEFPERVNALILEAAR